MRKIFKLFIQLFSFKKKEFGSLKVGPKGKLIYDYHDGYGEVKSLCEIVTVTTTTKINIGFNVSLENRP